MGRLSAGMAIRSITIQSAQMAGFAVQGMRALVLMLWLMALVAVYEGMAAPYAEVARTALILAPAPAAD